MSLRILWAVDPFLEEPEIHDHAFSLIKAFSSQCVIELFPVYALSDGMLGLSVKRKSLRKEIAPLVKTKFIGFFQNRELLRGGNINQHTPHVLVSAPSSRSTCARDVDSFAKKVKANFILVSSHGRKGIKRAFLGSFAETLVLQAKRPVLVIGPHNNIPSKIYRILFPTEFTDFKNFDLEEFNSVLSLCKLLSTEVVVLHAQPRSQDALIQAQLSTFGGAWSPMPKARADQEEKINLFFKELIDIGLKSKVKVSTELDIDSFHVSESILNASKTHSADMIAMPSKAGAVQAALLGSIGRIIVRESNVPVLILHK